MISTDNFKVFREQGSQAMEMLAMNQQLPPSGGKVALLVPTQLPEEKAHYEASRAKFWHQFCDGKPVLYENEAYALVEGSTVEVFGSLAPKHSRAEPNVFRDLYEKGVTVIVTPKSLWEGGGPTLGFIVDFD